MRELSFQFIFQFDLLRPNSDQISQIRVSVFFGEIRVIYHLPRLVLSCFQNLRDLLERVVV